ncbi:MAG: hypothetical protein H7Y04_14805 [Verrucomicrobia bacterium]|nr:hypothetical protein [Cytophagales bacterium]
MKKRIFLWYNIYFLLAGFFLFNSCQPKSAVKTGALLLPLLADWEFRQAGTAKWYPAQIPGSVHADLLANKLIDNPFVGLNERKMLWIEREDWEYQAVFEVKKEVLSHEHVSMVFEGLDSYANVYLNDSLLLEADNMFIAHRVPCEKYLRYGKNKLRIYFRSAVSKGILQASLTKQPVLAPAEPSRLKSSVFTRKAAFQFGSQVSPRLVSCGIWQPIKLLAWNTARITHLHIKQESLSDEKAILNAHVEILADKEVKAFIKISSKKKQFVSVQQIVALKAGNNTFSLNFDIQHPKRWWTNGLGEAYLYNVSTELSIDSTIADTASKNIGLRTLEVIYTKQDFSFVLNGVKIPVNGSVYVPNSIFRDKTYRERYKNLLETAHESNFNMIRVWGGGMYEEDEFYDLCDKKGLLVWQDLMFTNAMYPADDAMNDNIFFETQYVVKRLQQHPCMALWCGNDDIEKLWFSEGWQGKVKYAYQDSANTFKAYRKLFYQTIPEIVRRLDERFYLPSSQPFISKSKPLSVGKIIADFNIQSLPNFNTLQYFATEASDYNLDSPVMKHHQKWAEGNQKIKNELLASYQMPYNFENLVYLSQLTQAETLKKNIEAMRRKPNYPGVLYWHFNDCWTGISWATVDFSGTWKAGQYALKKAFAPVLVSPVVEGNILKVYVISDKNQTVQATLRVNLYDFSGQKLFQEERPVQIPAHSSGVYFQSDTWKKYLKGKNLRNLVLETVLLANNEELSRNFYYFTNPKFLLLPSPANIRAEVSGKNEKFIIEISSPRFQKNLQIQTKTLQGHFSDNFFDLLPNQKVTITFTPVNKKLSSNQLSKDLTIRSLSGSHR